MAKTIRIFKSFEEQELYNLEQMVKTTPLERFKNLTRMQNLTRLFNPATNNTRKIVIQHGRSAQ